MKPLSRTKEFTDKDLTIYEHRSILIDLAKQINGCLVKLKDGTLITVTLITDDDVSIERYEPWYELDDEEELRNYLDPDNEKFENFIRYRRLKNILDEK